MERTNKEQDEKATQASGDADARTDEAAVSQALFIREVQGHQRRYRKLIHLTLNKTIS